MRGSLIGAAESMQHGKALHPRTSGRIILNSSLKPQNFGAVTQLPSPLWLCATHNRSAEPRNPNSGRLAMSLRE